MEEDLHPALDLSTERVPDDPQRHQVPFLAGNRLNIRFEKLHRLLMDAMPEGGIDVPFFPAALLEELQNSWIWIFLYWVNFAIHFPARVINNYGLIVQMILVEIKSFVQHLGSFRVKRQLATVINFILSGFRFTALNFSLVCFIMFEMPLHCLSKAILVLFHQLKFLTIILLEAAYFIYYGTIAIIMIPFFWIEIFEICKQFFYSSVTR